MHLSCGLPRMRVWQIASTQEAAKVVPSDSPTWHRDRTRIESSYQTGKLSYLPAGELWSKAKRWQCNLHEHVVDSRYEFPKARELLYKIYSYILHVKAMDMTNANRVLRCRSEPNRKFLSHRLREIDRVSLTAISACLAPTLH